MHRFATEAGPGRIDYYFVAPPRRLDARFRARLREAVEAAAGNSADEAALRSIYVYRARDGIGAAQPLQSARQLPGGRDWRKVWPRAV